MSTRNNTTLASVIIIGSDVFELYPESYSKEAFKNSADAFHEYVIDELYGLGVSQQNILNLFSSDLRVDEQDRIITDFINKTSEETATVIIYYVGHGGFLSDRQYYLSMRMTDPSRRHFTGLKIRDLAETLKLNACNKKLYLILDCCFAGAAVSEFMSQDLSTHIENQTFSNLPEIGTALLVAASRDEPALTPDENSLTMLSESLIDILKIGSVNDHTHLSIREVGALVARRIRMKYGSYAVLPEIHAPKQTNSDIADKPIFPNNSYQKKRDAYKNFAPRLIYDSATETLAYQSWVSIKPNVPGLQDTSGLNDSQEHRVYSINSQSKSKIGANKYFMATRGKIELEYKIISSSGRNMKFFVKPLHVKTKEEFGTAWEGIRGYSMLYDDFSATGRLTSGVIKQSIPIAVSRWDSKEGGGDHIEVLYPDTSIRNDWTITELPFDFGDVAGADYCVFGARINEETAEFGPGRLLLRNVKIYQYSNFA